MLIALAAVPLVGCIGIGVDTARGYIAQSRLSAAIDAAALAGGNSFFASTRDDDIRMIFHTNFPDGYLGASVSRPTITADDANQKITVEASATVPTSFMRLFGSDAVTVAATAEVTRKMKALEVVLSMDMSGSMGTKDPGQTMTRLVASQQAAKELIDILFGGDTSKDLLNIGSVELEGQRHDRGSGVQRRAEQGGRRADLHRARHQSRSVQGLLGQQFTRPAAGTPADGMERVRLQSLRQRRDGRRRRRHSRRHVLRRR